jgi:hypothetical protein
MFVELDTRQNDGVTISLPAPAAKAGDGVRDPFRWSS